MFINKSLFDDYTLLTIDKQSPTASIPVKKELRRSVSFSEPQYKPSAAIGRCNSLTYMSAWAKAAMAETSDQAEGFKLCLFLTQFALRLMQDVEILTW